MQFVFELFTDLANSALGYQGINEHVDENDWYRLPGWQTVWLVN